MFALISLIRREFAAYFLSPVAYVTMVVFLGGTGILFFFVMNGLTMSGPQGIEYPMQQLLGNRLFWVIFQFILPLLTMRLLAEERGSGTLEMLLTAPIRDWQVVVGKYIGSLLFYIVMTLPMVVFLPVLMNLDWSTMKPGIDPWPIVTTAIGFYSIGPMFLALGLFFSSLVKSQLVAALIAMVAKLFFIVPVFILPELDANWLLSKMLTYISIPDHFARDFTRGVVDTRHLALYTTVAVFCLFLTVVSLEVRRLRA
ncbi:MAG: ABC transporter permease [Fimbriiglobus sp.]